jgi:parallel beta-helix repeat protein
MAILNVKEDYATIQEAVDAAVPGDTILVECGVYSESVVISTDALRIEGECGAELDGGFELDSAFYINGASNVKISSFEITHYIKNGITVNGGNSSSVSDCVISDCVESGVYAECSDGICITKVICSGCGDYGVSFRNLKGILTECRVESCGEGGMFFFSSVLKEVSVSLCSATDCPQGIEAYGVRLAAGCCKILNCSKNGIILQGGDNSAVEKSFICSCTQAGLNLSGSGNKVLGNRIYQNTNGAIVDSRCVVSSNDIRQSEALGLIVSGTGNTIANNTITGSGRADIVRYYAGNVFKNNIIERSIPPCL